MGCQHLNAGEHLLRLSVASPAQIPCTNLHRAFHFYPAAGQHFSVFNFVVTMKNWSCLFRKAVKLRLEIM
jgi:hypothetical protein